MSPRNLGGMGESKVEQWAHECGVTPNPVKNDSGGWDSFWQFPHVESGNATHEYPLDLKPPAITCMLQVKSTDQNKGRIKNIKLSNWGRMAKLPLPTFFVVLEYGGTNEVQRAYLVEVSEFWIGKTLKRLRQLKEGEENLLHKKTMTLTYSESDLLDNPSGEALSRRIIECVGHDPSAYYEKKNRWLRNVGFESFPRKASLVLSKMPYELAMNTLVDFAIGITEELRLDSAHIEEVRFGIPRSLDPHPAMRNIRMRIGEIPPTGNAQMAIFDMDDSLIYEDTFSFFSPTTLFPFIPYDYWKIRFSSEWFSLIVPIKESKFQMKLKPFELNKPTRISQLSQIAHFIRCLSSSDDLTFRVEITRDDQAFTFPIYGEAPPSIDITLDRILTTIEIAFSVIKQFHPFSDIKITLSELERQENRLVIMKNCLDNSAINHMSSSGDPAEMADIDLSSLAFQFCVFTVFGKTALVMSCCIQGIGRFYQDGEDKRICIENGRSRCIKKYRITWNALKNFDFEQALDESYQLLSDEGVRSVIRVTGKP